MYPSIRHCSPSLRKHLPRTWRLGIASILAFSLSIFRAHATPPGSGWTLSYDVEFGTLPTICHTVGSKTPGWLPTDYWNNHFVGDEDTYYCYPAIDTGYNPFSIGSYAGVSTLNITANKTPAGMSAGGKKYVSGELTTAVGAPYSTDIQSSTPFSQEYGYFETRCVLPTGQGQGYWPAFWMMPADGSSDAEYDIFEVLGNAPTTIYQSQHWGGYASNYTGTYSGGPNTSTGLHTYGFEWDAATVRWYVDGVITQALPNRINKAMYVLFDLAVGGSWPGEPNASTVFPGAMQVQYLRVYTGGSFGSGVRYETENLAVAAYSGPTAPRTVTGDANLSNSEAIILDSTAVSQYMSFVVPNVSAGTYDVKVGAKKLNTRGTWQLHVGRADNFAGTQSAVGSPYDEYSSAAVYTEVDLGNWSPGTTSDKWFQFQITGKNTASAGFGECIDYIILTRQ